MGDLLLCTGDSSADGYAANLVEYLREREYPGRIHAAAGHRTERAGANLTVNLVDHGVVGISEIFGSIPAYYSAFRTLTTLLREEPITTVVLMDFPGFNLQVLARWIRFQDLPVRLCYYIPPQVWAWRRGRIKKLREWFDELFVIFPFEQKFYRDHGIDARFVGHPMLEDRAEEPAYDLRDTLEIDPDRIIVGLFPGSRGSEIKNHLPAMASAADRLVEEDDRILPVVSAAPAVSYDHFDDVLGGSRHHDYPIWGADARSLLEASRTVMVASGSITMDAAFARRPMVVGYRTSWFSYQVGKRLISSDHVAMPNLLDSSVPVPELIQSEFTPDRLVEETLRLLRDEEAFDRQRQALERICQQFSARRASREVGDRLLELAHG